MAPGARGQWGVRVCVMVASFFRNKVGVKEVAGTLKVANIIIACAFYFRACGVLYPTAVYIPTSTFLFFSGLFLSSLRPLFQVCMKISAESSRFPGYPVWWI